MDLDGDLAVAVAEARKDTIGTSPFHVQFRYRDPVRGTCGGAGAFNLTNALVD